MKVNCSINGSIKLHFITDAFNGFFSKNVGNGKREYSHPGMVVSNQLLNGRDSINIRPSQSNPQLQINQIIPFKITIYDRKKEKFNQTIDIKITAPIEPPVPPVKPDIPVKPDLPDKPTERKKSAFILTSSDDGTGQEKINPPKIRGISKQIDQKLWEKHFGNGREMKGSRVFQKDKEFTIFVNLSHPTLTDSQNKATTDPKKAAKKHTQTVGLIPWALYLLQESKSLDFFKTQDDPDQKYTIVEFMEMVSDAIAFFGIDVLDQMKRN